MRVVFLGTPEFAVPTLSELVARGHEVVAVYTRAPAAAGRGMGERKSPVHEAAEKFGIAVHHPKTLRGDEAADLFRSHAADIAVVGAYGLILPRRFSMRRLTAVSIFTRRCCPAGGVPRLSIARSWPVTPNPA